MEVYQNKPGAQIYREAVAARCRTKLDRIVQPVEAVVALGKRNLLWDLLLDAVLPNVLEMRDDK